LTRQILITFLQGKLDALLPLIRLSLSLSLSVLLLSAFLGGNGSDNS
jgi:hypothetical protein